MASSHELEDGLQVLAGTDQPVPDRQNVVNGGSKGAPWIGHSKGGDIPSSGFIFQTFPEGEAPVVAWDFVWTLNWSHKDATTTIYVGGKAAVPVVTGGDVHRYTTMVGFNANTPYFHDPQGDWQLFNTQAMDILQTLGSIGSAHENDQTSPHSLNVAAAGLENLYDLMHEWNAKFTSWAKEIDAPGSDWQGSAAGVFQQQLTDFAAQMQSVSDLLDSSDAAFKLRAAAMQLQNSVRILLTATHNWQADPAHSPYAALKKVWLTDVAPLLVNGSGTVYQVPQNPTTDNPLPTVNVPGYGSPGDVAFWKRLQVNAKDVWTQGVGPLDHAFGTQMAALDGAYQVASDSFPTFIPQPPAAASSTDTGGGSGSEGDGGALQKEIDDANATLKKQQDEDKAAFDAAEAKYQKNLQDLQNQLDDVQKKDGKNLDDSQDAANNTINELEKKLNDVQDKDGKNLDDSQDAANKTINELEKKLNEVQTGDSTANGSTITDGGSSSAVPGPTDLGTSGASDTSVPGPVPTVGGPDPAAATTLASSVTTPGQTVAGLSGVSGADPNSAGAGVTDPQLSAAGLAGTGPADSSLTTPGSSGAVNSADVNGAGIDGSGAGGPVALSAVPSGLDNSVVSPASSGIDGSSGGSGSGSGGQGVLGPDGQPVLGANGQPVTVPDGSTLNPNGTVTGPDGQPVLGPTGQPVTVPPGSTLAPGISTPGGSTLDVSSGGSAPPPGTESVLGPNGQPVLGANGQPVTVPDGSTLNSNGTVTGPDGQLVNGANNQPITVPPGSALSPSTSTPDLSALPTTTVTAPNGQLVTGANGQPVTIPDGSTVNSNGTVSGPDGQLVAGANGQPLTVPGGSAPTDTSAGSLLTSPASSSSGPSNLIQPNYQHTALNSTPLGTTHSGALSSQAPRLGNYGGGGFSGGSTAAANRPLTSTEMATGHVHSATPEASSPGDLVSAEMAAEQSQLMGRVATTGGGAAGGSDGQMIPPMSGGGGGGGGGSGSGQGARKTWVTEDEDVWGTEAATTSGVLGR